MPNLILIPTEIERRIVSPLLANFVSNELRNHGWQIELVGFGPIAAAARSSQLIAEFQPQQVCLIGIAGTFDAERAPVNSALCFDTVACDGIGVGSGSAFVSSTAMGWPMILSPKIDDVLQLTAGDKHNHLLSVCAASADEHQAAKRRDRYPNVIAEDMEGFGVALSCRLANVPLQVVRGISNQVGDRNTENWRIDSALRSAAELAVQRGLEGCNE